MSKPLEPLLVNPPEEVIVALSTEEGVATKDVVSFLNGIKGLTEVEALVVMDTLSFRKSWNMATRMACAEGIDYARTQEGSRNN